MNLELISYQFAYLIRRLVVGLMIRGDDKTNFCFSSVHASRCQEYDIHGWACPKDVREPVTAI